MADNKKSGGEGPKKKPARSPASRPVRQKPAAEKVRAGAIQGDRDPSAHRDAAAPGAAGATNGAPAAPRRRHVRSAERPTTVLRLRFQALPPDEAVPTLLEEGVAKIGHTDDLSMGGAFVTSAVLPPVGARIAVELDLASTWQPLVVLGDVRWHKASPKGFGVQFVDLSAQAHVALGQLLTTLSFKD